MATGKAGTFRVNTFGCMWMADVLDDAAAVFAALGEATRLSLVGELVGGEARTLSQLAADRSISRQAVTKHLNQLVEAQVVELERVGRENRYRLCPDGLHSARAYLDQVGVQWDAAIGRLQQHLGE